MDYSECTLHREIIKGSAAGKVLRVVEFALYTTMYHGVALSETGKISLRYTGVLMLRDVYSTDLKLHRKHRVGCRVRLLHTLLFGAAQLEAWLGKYAKTKTSIKSLKHQKLCLEKKSSTSLEYELN